MTRTLRSCVRTVRLSHTPPSNILQIVAGTGILRAYMQTTEPVLHELIAPSDKAIVPSAVQLFANGALSGASFVAHRDAAVKRAKSLSLP